MKVIARRINEVDFSPFGMYYNMYETQSDVKHTSGASYEDHMTCKPLIDTFAHLGLTLGIGAPCKIVSMEKHSHTQEAIMCMSDPIIFCVAPSHGDEAPLAQELKAFLMHPGDVAIIEREIWHDACHGLGQKTAYYWLALAGAKPAVWQKVNGDAELTWDSETQKS